MRTKTRSAPTMERGSWHGHGAIQNSRSGFLPTARRRSPRWVIQAFKGRTWSSWRIRPTSTTWWFALYAPVIRGRRSDFRPTGIRQHLIDPRGVLREFGVDIPESTEVRVWDSNAELRYLVLPSRPEGTEKLSESDLAKLVTRDS